MNYEREEVDVGDCEVCGLPLDECECPCVECKVFPCVCQPERDGYGEHLAAEEETRQAAERKAFGAECKVMADLLAVHKLPHDWDTAKEWMREFDGEGADGAAPWLDAGWTDPIQAGGANRTFETPAKALAVLIKHNLTVASVCSKGSDVSVADLSP